MEDFIPCYPDINSDDFYKQIISKYEFFNNEQEEPFFFEYQKNIARFLSAKTLYDSLLLIHEMGTGKSGSAIATAHLVRQQDPSFRRVLIMANGRTQLNNFRQEVIERLPFLKTKYADTTDPRVILRREGYIFETYRLFAKQIQNKGVEELRNLFENSIIIMDELHNLTASAGGESSTEEEKGGLTNIKTYNILYNMVHSLKNRKLLCLTGTPIRDKPQEIAKILNMVLPIEKKMPTGEQFKNEYLQVEKTVSSKLGDVELSIYRFRQDKQSEFEDKIKGYVSCLKKSLPKNINILFQTNHEIDLSTHIDHFPVYADIMKEPQNQIYINDLIMDLQTTSTEQEEQKEVFVPSLAYTRSRQSALMVFPEKKTEYIIPVYEKSVKDITKKGKYIKTISWSKEMHKLFPKNLGLEERLELLSSYSCIYSKIIREIIFHPSELTYIYGFLKSGSGLYALVSLLVQYFNFSIVKNINDLKIKTSNRRLMILNHDFMSDQDLREMIDFFNQDGNAFGEYIQVVIGTKQTKEGITLKNIRQIHIIQPEWNYADISQAIGRGIRVKSHDALLTKLSKVDVKIFQHAAIPIVDDNPDLDSSIDIEQYRRSEIKDMSIKMIERRLIECSWDCYLNQERNTGMVDYSRECEYDKCLYFCKGIPKDIELRHDFTTYNMFYSDMARTMLLEKIKVMFESTFFLREEEILSSISKNNHDLVKIVLDDIMTNLIPIMNSRRDICYLRKSKENIYYLVLSPDQYNLSDVYYNTNLTMDMFSSFQDVSRRLYQIRFPSMMTSIITQFYQNEHDHCRSVILQSPLFLQEILVETILLLKYANKIQNSFFRFVLDHYENQKRLEKTDNMIVSTILSDEKRILDLDKSPLQWTSKEISTEPETTAEEDTEFIRKFITENPYKYYGIVEVSKDKTVFKIRDVSNQELVFGSNKSKIPKGEICAGSFSRKKIGLIKILMILGWTHDSDVSESLSEFIKKNNKLLKDLDIDSKDVGRVRSVMFLNKQKIPVLCGYARKRFEELDLIFTKKV